MANDKIVDLRIRLPEDLRSEFKAKCATARTNMNDQANQLIREWVDSTTDREKEK